jgi:hypothetical protein
MKWSCFAKIASAPSLCSAIIGGLVAQGLPGTPSFGATNADQSSRGDCSASPILAWVLPLLAAISLALRAWLGEISP